MRVSLIAQRFQPIVFGLLLFLVPTNLFLKFFVTGAYVDGLLVDYLLPKLYLSDIFLIVLIGLWCVELGAPRVRKNLLVHAKSAGVLFVVLAINAIASANSGHLASTLWFDIKLFEMWIFLAWLLEKKSLLKSSTTFFALSSAIIFQAAVGAYQYVTQRSIFGYWFFGEPLLSADPMIAKSSYSGALTILPYGTTPHPNILAGFVVMATLLCLFISTYQRSKMFRVFALLMAVASSALSVMTQSFSAGIALIFGLVLFCTYGLFPGIKKQLGLVSVVLAGALFLAIPGVLFFLRSPDPSILRRNQLEHIAVSMFLAHPLTGVGLNTFTSAMSGFGSVTATLRFLQPVHNVPLLLLSELGLLGFALIAFILNIVHKMYSLNIVAFSVLGVPYIVLLSLDHYALSVQSGLLLSTILVATMLEKKSQLHG